MLQPEKTKEPINPSPNGSLVPYLLQDSQPRQDEGQIDIRAPSESPVASATPIKHQSNFKSLLRVFRYNDRTDVILNGIALMAIVASGTLLPVMDIFFGQFVNTFNDFAVGELSPAEYRRKVAKYSLYFVYLFVAKLVTSYVWMVLISITAIRTTKSLRVEFVRSTLRQEISFFDSPSASISGQITTNGNLINNGISEKLGLTIQAISTFITAFAIAFAYQWKLTLIILSIVPLNLIVTIICVFFDTLYERKVFEIYSRSGYLAEEAFSTIRTAHAFWAFPKLSKRFTDIIDEAYKVGSKKSIVYAILFPTEFFCVFAGYGLAFWQGIRMYSRGEIDEPGTVITVVFAVLVAAQALTQVAPQTVAISKCAAAAQELFDLIDRKSKIDSLSQDGSTIEDLKGHIQVKKVWFSYPTRPHVHVLRGLSLEILPGQTTALVGASGSGKSSIFGLVERWYNFSTGSITLDGHEIGNLNLRWLRTNIRLVQQEPTLFSGTIFQNVADGLIGTNMANMSTDETKHLVIESCKASYAHDFIMALPDGYNTWIGERGASLSGGQKQRIVIARSIISNPKVIMLDEATSALDPKAEEIVQQALNNIAKGRTVIIIAHRLSTIRNADKIIVLSQGELVEQGSHNELMEMKSAYWRLVEGQDLGTKQPLAEDSSTEAEEASEIKDSGGDREANPSRQSEGGSFEPMVNDDIDRGLFRSFWFVVQEQRPLWASMALLSLVALIAGGTYPALAVLFSKTMNAFQAVDVGKGNFFSLMFFVVALVNFLLYAIAGWFSNEIGQYLMRRYRIELFEDTLAQDMAFFDNPEHGSGGLVSRLGAESTSLQDLFSINLVLILVNIVNVISSSILAIAVGWKLGLALALGALPAIVLAGYIRIRLESKLEEDASKRFAKSSSFASEAILGIRTVSSLALEDVVIHRYQDSLHTLAKDSITGIGWKMVFYALSQSISFLAMALGFWYGGRLVSTGEYNTQQFYTIFIAILFSGEASAMLFQYSTSISNVKLAVNYIIHLRKHRMIDNTAVTSNIENRRQGVQNDTSCEGPAIQFENVHFSYPSRSHLKVLKDINLNIKSNRKVAFVGASGCGKSTMISLLERFYDPTKGTILQDEHDIKEKNRRLYRNDIALVQQEPVLYQGSIYENIVLGVEAETLPEEVIIKACIQAHIWDFISSLPDGLNTSCGSQGFALSGGQRQRIAIARALVRQPRLLLLDEATSALDTGSEKIVKAALDAASIGRTTIAIAHRLSTIRDSDLIVVFAAGQVVEQGTHEELVAKKGVYHEMVISQSLDREA